MVSDIDADRAADLFESVQNRINVVALSPSETMRYFTEVEMHKSERPTLVFLFRDQPPAVVLPNLEADRITEALPGADIYTYSDAVNPVDAARDAFERLTADREITEPIGVEFRSTRLLEKQVFAANEEEVADIENAVTTLRARKDEMEIRLMQTAADIIDEILEEVFGKLEPGMSERDIETAIRRRVIESDADKFGIGTVTAGEHTSHAHANTSTRTIGQGDLVMVDAGVVYEGYYSDITRTVALDDPGAELQEVYEVVQEAAAAARRRVAPGVEFQEIDRAARRVIEDAGYGEYFPHRVGHGLGLEGHEPPYLVEGNDDKLKVGHAITVEPGIYVPDLGGVRIEDDVIVSEDGADVLTTSSRDLQLL